MNGRNVLGVDWDNESTDEICASVKKSLINQRISPFWEIK